MAAMTDPNAALILYQQAFQAGQIPLQPGKRDRELFVAIDQPNGRTRFSYIRVDGQTLSVLVMFAQNGTVEGMPCFNIGYAVAEPWRGKGLAKSTLVAALAELEQGLGDAGIPAIHVEAVIDVGHVISQRIAADIFDDPPSDMIDEESGLPALHYTRALDLRRRSHP